MASFYFGETILVTDSSALAERVGQESLIVTGPARGGTSLLAFTLYSCGYFLGARLGRTNYEDVDIRPAISAALHQKDHAQLRELIQERNQKFTRWGFKVPLASRHIGTLAAMMRNPVTVVAYRNPLATARTIYKRDQNFPREELSPFIAHGLTLMLEATRSIMRSGVPAILVNIDEARRFPSTFVTEFFSSLKIDVPNSVADEISSKLALNNYQTSEAQDGVIFV